MSKLLLKCHQCDRLHFEVTVVKPYVAPCLPELIGASLKLECKNCSAVVTVKVDEPTQLMVFRRSVTAG